MLESARLTVNPTLPAQIYWSCSHAAKQQQNRGFLGEASPKFSVYTAILSL
jgi:hypothetical protein